MKGGIIPGGGDIGLPNLIGGNGNVIASGTGSWEFGVSNAKPDAVGKLHMTINSVEASRNDSRKAECLWFYRSLS
jgi:hypothetical protein